MKPLALVILIAAALPLAAPATAQPKGCPPGLQKKNPPCVPPGLAKKQKKAVREDTYHNRYDDRLDDDYYSRYEDRQYDLTDDSYDRSDDRYYITGDYVPVTDPWRYGLDPDRTYYRFGDNVFRVDRETGEILDFIGSLAALLD